MTSVLNVDTIADKAGTGPVGLTKQHAAKAWVNYNQATPATVDSFSISSVTDSTTGEYKINVSNAFDSSGYSCSGIGKGEAAVSLGRISEDHDNSRTTSQMPIITSRTSDGAYRDLVSSATIHGDLA